MNPLRRLKPYLKPYWGHIFWATILAIPLSALRAAPAPLVKYFVDELLVQKHAEKLLWFPLVFIGIYIVNFGVRFFHYYLLRIVVARVNQKLKNDLFEHLLGLSADHFTSQSTGGLISRVGSDTQHVDGGLACINIVVREPITFIFLFGYALHLHWKLTLITLMIFPPMAWVFSRTGKNLKRYIQKLNESNASIFAVLQESFSGIRIVKAFQLERYVRNRFFRRSEAFAQALLKTAKLEEAAHPMVELLIAIAVALLLYYGGSLVISGQMEPGGLTAFLATFALMMNPVRQMNDVNLKLNAASSACKRIFEIFDWQTSLKNDPNPKPVTALNRALQFKNVNFAYPDEPSRMILKDVSFDVAAGKVIAFVGKSGAGKSSLVSLLPRVFDVSSGTIQWDGVDIRELKLENLRRLISVVSQDVFLFNDTIEENIRCGRLSATHAEILEAAKHAHALEFIQRLPDGFQTVIGDRGQKLSGGEKQRLSIARAFLRESPVLILDEATSSLDNESEKQVQSALDELMQTRTTLMIAHRLTTVRNADEIYVLKDGQIVQRGTYTDLLNQPGEFQALHQASHSSYTAQV